MDKQLVEKGICSPEHILTKVINVTTKYEMFLLNTNYKFLAISFRF